MRYFLLLIFLYSCTQPASVKKSLAKNTQHAAAFNCNYDSSKIRCQQLYKSYKENKIAYSNWFLYVQDSLLPCWYGTLWSFNGTTEKPNEGSIACGYFVTTVLRDAGIPVQRIKMAQCASEQMIRTVCDQSSVNNFSNYSIEKFCEALKTKPEGLYIVGLDNHTGFITIEKDGIYFTHSSFVKPGYVIKEKAISSIVLSSSRYRVVGRVRL